MILLALGTAGRYPTSEWVQSGYSWLSQSRAILFPTLARLLHRVCQYTACWRLPAHFQGAGFGGQPLRGSPPYQPMKSQIVPTEWNARCSQQAAQMVLYPMHGGILLDQRGFYPIERSWSMGMSGRNAITAGQAATCSSGPCKPFVEFQCSFQIQESRKNSFFHEVYSWSVRTNSGFDCKSTT